MRQPQYFRLRSRAFVRTLDPLAGSTAQVFTVPRLGLNRCGTVTGSVTPHPSGFLPEAPEMLSPVGFQAAPNM